MRNLIILILFALAFTSCSFDDVVLRSRADLNVSISPDEAEVVKTALDIFAGDYQKVFDGNIVPNENAQLIIGTLGNNSDAEQMIDQQTIEYLRGHEEAFIVRVIDNKIYVLGSDKRGTAYGILELSRLIGVSPWEWWADSAVEKKKKVTLEDGLYILDNPSVARRGIFLNDEDWGLMPWSYRTNEPSDVKGRIGPETHARIFELLLRLRANTFWPAMHDCSVAFFLTPGNKEMADKYGIFIGTSHCEPMVRNTNAEWKQWAASNISGSGASATYDYVNNRENVLRFWEERVKELAGSDNIYTLGIRGVHDSKMLGANTLQEQKDAIINVLKDQRNMIAQHVNPNVEEVSQVFIPYKEVLDVYNMGLEVPEDVALMWCDDNYGYIRHFPTPEEAARKGGNGVYYHASYWGRPHDYLWLATNHPAQIYTQMKLAYDKGARDMWVLNVGDIKPAEYLIELFLDMAWNIDAIDNDKQGLDLHLQNWLKREFGNKPAQELLSVMNEYYRLAYIRKPEFMGNTRTEEKDPAYKVVTDLPWSEEEIRQRLAEYKIIEDKVKDISASISPEKHNAWFQLVEYPVRGASEMNQKHLYGQLARHGKESWSLSDAAYDEIIRLTEQYSNMANGKWRYMMDAHPRKLPVFDRVPQTAATAPLMQKEAPVYLFNGTAYADHKGDAPLAHGLGYEREAISLPSGSTVSYPFEWAGADSIRIEVALAPNHPVNGKTIRYAIAIDDEQPKTIDYRTEGRSEEWKENVLRNQAIRITAHAIKQSGKHTLNITALDEGVVVDQIKLYRR
ncbi:glycosyl hydrolase 115 family protein [Bacteroides sp. 51]|uniref:glycosyl hydrolase 115 family protein n=1 Tax=Bacteroides sp. 51 TaxID=2302938 RepID=UPI0013D108B2|nr:glycosyl hydrolase 115 family protein [Bacteroides sp. 51]NDV81807.1 hypothetical protein [Bacteroides sp. 51]